LAEAAHESPLDQFLVSPVIRLPKLFGIDVSITNSSMVMIAALVVLALFYLLAMRKRATIPGRAQSFAEVMYEFVQGIIEENAGHAASLRYFPIIFTLFLFILAMNLIGLLPYSFAPTSHIIVTFAMGATAFLVITLIGIVKQGPLKFLKHFVPAGLPLWIVPLVFVIELVSYLARPFSLSLRLAANMMAGHTLIHVIAGFVVPLGIAGILPLAFLTGMMGLEVFVAILQAYIFTLLACMYLGEALAEEHH
jgi:F-type H+-transporting ATPase subunit a